MISKFRLTALSIHLVCSIFVITAVTAVSLFVWFPHPWYEIDGTFRALLIVFGVDIVIGPILTLVVSNNKKSLRELLFDFSLILLLQLGALGFGISELYKQRVAAIVYLEGRFHLVPYSKVVDTDTTTYGESYNGVAYGMLRYLDFEGLDQAGIEVMMSSPSEYRKLAALDLDQYPYAIEAVPETLLSKHGRGVYYRLVSGKNKNGIAVINQDMQIIDIDVVHE